MFGNKLVQNKNTQSNNSNSQNDILNCNVIYFVSAFHDVSVYPKKDLPFFILFTAGLCSFTALLALLTHHYPEPMGYLARTVSTCNCFFILM
mgnify:CR=1 FL=1